MYSAFVLGLAFASQDAVSPYRSLVEGYYESVLHRRADPRIHSVKHIGPRTVRDQEAQLVCVSYTMRLRFGGDHDMVEALFFVGDQVVRREGGNEALMLCSVV